MVTDFLWIFNCDVRIVLLIFHIHSSPWNSMQPVSAMYITYENAPGKPPRQSELLVRTRDIDR